MNILRFSKYSILPGKVKQSRDFNVTQAMVTYIVVAIGAPDRTRRTPVRVYRLGVGARSYREERDVGGMSSK
eukprot:1393305-Amorphochlora_amoeboformis.AAC.1